MCELFAISSRLPATVSLSLKTLAEHGGGSAPHADGWGIAYYRQGDARVIKDTSAAHDSDWVRFVQSRGLSGTTIISHIRKATRGGVRLQNTHPFARELGGQMHVLAHNGTLKGVNDHPDFALGHFHPIGAADVVPIAAADHPHRRLAGPEAGDFGGAGELRGHGRGFARHLIGGYFDLNLTFTGFRCHGIGRNTEDFCRLFGRVPS